VRNGVAMSGPDHQRAKNQHIERALQHVAAAGL
jgi:hypothetical protein